MKRIYFLICLFLGSFFSLFSEIIETKNFKEIIKYIQPETLVLVDIDDTILLPVQTLGTDVWFLSRLDHHLQEVKERSLALELALAEWEAVRHLTSVKVVEEGTNEVIDDMQNKNIVIMGLTTQGLALATRTVIQLKSLSIDLSKTAPSTQDCYFINGSHGVLYRNGILFTSGSCKGEALFKFLDTINYYPKHIVFINDKKTHLEDIGKSAELRKVDFLGLRYSYSDFRVANFSKDIADIQWKHSTFDHLLSDEEASALLAQ